MLRWVGVAVGLLMWAAGVGVSWSLWGWAPVRWLVLALVVSAATSHVLVVLAPVLGEPAGSGGHLDKGAAR